jgi:tetratricopeptide (TPR) repeat protein
VRGISILDIDNAERESILNSILNRLDIIRALHKQKKYHEAFVQNEGLLSASCALSEVWYRRGLLIQQLLDEEGASVLGPLTLSDALNALQTASKLSTMNGHPLIEEAYYLYALSGEVDLALDKFSQAKEHSLSLLRDSLIGEVKCLIDLKKFTDAEALLRKAFTYIADDLDVKMLKDELDERSKSQIP